MRIHSKACRIAIQLEILIIPFLHVLTDLEAQVILDLRKRQVKAGSAPRRIKRGAIRPLRKPVLLVSKPRIIKRAGKGHEPNTRDHAMSCNHIGCCAHAILVAASRVVSDKDLIRTVLALSELPAVVNLHDIHPKLFQFSCDKLCTLLHLLLIGCAVHIPGAMDSRHGRELDRVHLGYSIGIRLKAQTRIIKITDCKRFKSFGCVRLQQQPAIIHTRHHRLLLCQHNATAAIRGHPAAHHAIARLRIHHGNPHITAHVFFCRVWTARGHHRCQRCILNFKGGIVDAIRHRLG